MPKFSFAWPKLIDRFHKKPSVVPRSKAKRIVIITLASLGAILIAATAFTVVVAFDLKKQAYAAKDHAVAAYAALKNQDLAGTKAGLDTLKSDVNAIAASYAKISFWNYTPLHWHYQDGLHLLRATGTAIDSGELVVASIEPYADVIGFKGQGSFVGGTAEDRIVKIIETLDKISPTLDQLVAQLNSIDHELSAINPARYPFSLKGQSVSGLLTTAKSQLNQTTTIISDYQPLLQKLPQIAGVDNPRHYLILFQNDAELRATGGFLTAYAVLKVDKGKVTPEKSDDIYDLDNKFTKNLQPPDPLKKYLLVSTWHLRDMNWSPDFKDAMALFMQYYNQLPGEPKVDGVIALDTTVLKDMITVLGALEVPGFGTFSPEVDKRCDCPNVIYELEDIIGKPTPFLRSERKAVLGPMMQTLLFKAYGAPKQQWPALFQTLWTNMTQKHILFNFNDPSWQQAVEQVDLAGRMPDTPENTDFLAVIDSNLGGAKTNMFVTTSYEEAVTVGSGNLQKTLTITYKNPYKGSNCNLEAGQLCLNGVLRDYLRIYVPAGSQLTGSTGLAEDSVTTYQDLGKTVFAGFFTLDPESQAKIRVSYTVPLTVQGTYRQYLQKQPGTKTAAYTLTLNDTLQPTYQWATDKLMETPLP